MEQVASHSRMIVEVQAQLRTALAALPDPPDPDCPVGARAHVSEDKTELRYIFECRAF